MPPRRRAASKPPPGSDPSPSTPAKPKTPARRRATSRDPSTAVEGMGQTRRKPVEARAVGTRRGLRSRALDNSPIEVAADPEKLLQGNKPKAPKRKLAETPASPVAEALVVEAPPKESEEESDEETLYIPVSQPSEKLSVIPPTQFSMGAINARRTAQLEEVLQEVASLRSQNAALISQNQELQLTVIRQADEASQHIFRNVQLEAVVVANGISLNDVYQLSPEELEDQAKLSTMAPASLASPSSVQLDSVTGDVGALDLLHKIERNKDLALSNRYSMQNERPNDSEVGMVMDEEGKSDQFSTPKADSAHNPEVATPKSTGWGFGGFLRRLLPTFSSPAPTPASTHAPAAEPTQSPVVMPPAMEEEVRESLKPTEQPTQRSKPTKKVVKQAGSKLPPLKVASFEERIIAREALKAVNPSEKDKAKEWFDGILEKIGAKNMKPGEKRKRLEKILKIDDLKQIPARAPWQSEGTFGMQDDFFDESDDEGEVPGWHYLQLLAEDDESEVPRKKRKVVDTDSQEASSSSMNPRPAHVASPMFSQSQRHQRGNVFLQDETSSRRSNSHVASSGTFRVPDSDSDEDLDDMATQTPSSAAHAPTSVQAPSSAAQTSKPAQAPSRAAQASDVQAPSSAAQVDVQPWTQQPPPAPVPAHASLPGTPSTMSAPPFNAEEARVRAARDKATPYKPTNPSRLRNQQRRSSVGDDEPGATATGTGLGNGLLTQPHDAAPSSDTPTVTQGSGPTSDTSLSTTGQPDLVPHGHFNGDGTHWTGEFPKQDVDGSSGSKVSIGPIPAIVEHTNAQTLTDPLNLLIDTHSFLEQSLAFWQDKDTSYVQDHPELFSSDISSDDDNDNDNDTFPTGEKALTPQELDTQV